MHCCATSDIHACSHITVMATINESLCYRTGMLIHYLITQRISNSAKFQLLCSFKGLVCPLHFNPIALQN